MPDFLSFYRKDEIQIFLEKYRQLQENSPNASKMRLKLTKIERKVNLLFNRFFFPKNRNTMAFSIVLSMHHDSWDILLTYINQRQNSALTKISLGLPEDFGSVAKRGWGGYLALESHLICSSIKSCLKTI